MPLFVDRHQYNFGFCHLDLFPWPRATTTREPSQSLGLDLDTHLPGPQGRPFALVDFGVREVKELF